MYRLSERNFGMADNLYSVPLYAAGCLFMGGSVYDYGRRDSYKTEHDGGTDIKYGRFLDELGWEFCQEGRRRQDICLDCKRQTVSEQG